MREFYSGIASPPKLFEKISQMEEKNFIREKAGYSSFSISNDNPFDLGACLKLYFSMSKQKREYMSS